MSTPLNLKEGNTVKTSLHIGSHGCGEFSAVGKTKKKFRHSPARRNPRWPGWQNLAMLAIGGE
jgi:hypothetical protein